MGRNNSQIHQLLKLHIVFLNQQEPNHFLGLFEYFLAGKLGDRLDARFMKKTMNHWARKFGEQFSEEDFLLSFKSGKNISKHHPQHFQKRVLEQFNNKLKEIEEQHKIELGKIRVELN